MYIASRNRNKHMRQTTKGSKLLVKFKDRDISWTQLKDLEEGDPNITAEYDVKNKISEETYFVWWVPYTLRKCDRIISRVKDT